MTRKSVFMCVLTIVMVAYFAFALTVTARMARTECLSGLEVRLAPSKTNFIEKADIVHESGLDPDSLKSVRRSGFDLYSLEKRLADSDKIQDANASILSNGTVLIEVTPMEPVARVFEYGQPSYYINAGGKSISAELRYHLDVPVLVGRFDSVHPASRLLPLLDYIANHPEASALVATVTQEADGNIILIPNIVGHVINFGDTTMVADKFQRLRTFYRHVAPVKGWNAYDTVAVRWRGQVVATRRDKAMPPVELPTVEEQTGSLDIDDNETITDPDEIERAVDSSNTSH
ncbi:MAG: hypothetical protein K2L92_03095 [Muribaculaceae bacterium]|nr:hypothetical protein [Muribaculaceae bacterium]